MHITHYYPVIAPVMKHFSSPHILLLSSQRISDVNTALSIGASDDFFSHYRLVEFLSRT